MRDYVACNPRDLAKIWQSVGPTEHRVRLMEIEMSAIQQDIWTLGAQLAAAQRIMQTARSHRQLAEMASPEGHISARDVLEPRTMMGTVQAASKAAADVGYTFVLFNDRVYDTSTCSETGLTKEDLK